MAASKTEKAPAIEDSPPPAPESTPEPTANPLVRVRNVGPGPIVLAHRYLEAGEWRDVTEAQLEAAQADLGENAGWIEIVAAPKAIE